MRAIKKKIDTLRTWMIGHQKKAHLILICMLIVTWIPYYLSYFPGVVRYDELLCIKRALGDLSLSNHHPIILVLYLKVVIEVITKMGGSMNAAIGVATFIQMCFLAIVVSYAALFIVVRVPKLWCGIVAILFWAFSPIVALYSVVLGKDAFFTGWLMLYVITIYKTCLEDFLACRKNMLFLTFIFIMIGLARSNGLYIMLGMMPVLIGGIKEYRKKIVMCSIGAILVIGLIKGPIFAIFDVAESPIAESFSVPIQQIANTLAKEGNVSNEDLEYLDQILPLEDWKNNYTAGIVDTIKFHDDFQTGYLNKTAGKFLQVWAKNLFPNLKWYVQAYIEQIRGFWDVTQIVNTADTDMVENSYGIERIDCIELLTGISLQPLCGFAVLIMRKLPIANFLTNQFLLAVLYMGIFIILIRRKEHRKAIILVPSLLLWLTLLIAAPVSSEFRYMLSFHFMIPIVLGLMCNMKEVKSNG